ncbi:MAG: TIGR00341 family protein, partial [Planctomycetes bacterium]|nr:TIGR00341 family protein [Planctomycetota bacterium]
MAFRILEVIVPEAELARVSDLLENQNVVHSWMTRGEQATGMVRVLLDVQNTEALTDLFVRHFGSWPGFRLILLPIEATLPVIEPEGPTPDLREEKTPKGPLRISREELIEDIAEASNVNWVYVATVVLSTVVAGVGLIRGDVAVVIGGMVIAPLLGPNI